MDFDLAAAAEAAGYRACLRCRPYRSPSPPVQASSDLVCRAVHLIVAGALDGGSEAQLGARLGVSDRHLRRLFQRHLGVSPDQLARSRRSHFARRLLDDTDLPVAQVAVASGFGSVRQLNRSCRETFGTSPHQLRSRRRVADRLAADGGLSLRLLFRGHLDWPAMAGYLARRAIPGVEVVADGHYRRTIVVEGDPGVLEVGPGGDEHLVLRAHLPHWEGLIHVVDRVRGMLGLDADMGAALEALGRDRLIGPLVFARPGLRVPGTWDPFETGVRAIVGQQVSVGAASTIAGRLVQRLGRPVPGLGPMGLSHVFPAPHTVARADLEGLGLPTPRQEAVRAFASAVAADRLRLDGSISLEQLVASITALDGLGPWTAHYLALRMGEPDAFPASDLGLRRALARLDPGAASPGSLEEAWRPFRALAAVQLWASLDASKERSP